MTANPVILAPWVPDQATYYLVVQDGTTIERLSFSVTVGREYWLSADRHKDGVDVNGVGRGDLVRILTDCIDTHSTIAEGDTSASIAATTGILTITTSGSSFAIFWDHPGTTIDGRIFGFNDKSFSNATSHVGDFSVFGWFYPGRPASVDTRRNVDVNRTIVAPYSGSPKTSYWGTKSPMRMYKILLLEQEKILREYATNETESFEWIYEQSIGRGYPFRIYDDSSNTDNGAAVYVLANTNIPHQQNANYSFRWDLNFDLIEITPYQNTGGVSQMFNSIDPPETLTLSRYWAGSMSKVTWMCRVYFPSAHSFGAVAESLITHASSILTFMHGLFVSGTGTDFEVHWHEDGGGGSVRTTGITVTTGTHYCIVLSVDLTQASNADKVRIHVNGVDRTGTPSGTFSSSPTVATPAAATDGFLVFDDYSGLYNSCDDCYMSDLAIWHDQALSEAAADEIYNGGTSIDLTRLKLAPHPARWWRLNGNINAQIRTTNSTITASDENYIAGYPGNRP